MSPRRGYSREEVLKLLQAFYRDSGRPPRRNEPGFGRVLSAAEREFGSWNHALRIAGLQTFKSWHKKETVGGRILTLLNNNPMTLAELRQEFMKTENSSQQSKTAVSIALSTAIQNTHEIKSLGTRRSMVYFLQGQEKLAQNHNLVEEKEDCIYCALRKPMTKNEIRNLFPQTNTNSCTDRLLKELISAELVRKIEFIAGCRGAQKYNATELFGNFAGKTFYFRLDCPEELADFVIKNIPRSRIQDSGFTSSLTRHLKRILPENVYSLFTKRMNWWEGPEESKKPKSPHLDDYLQE